MNVIPSTESLPLSAVRPGVFVYTRGLAAFICRQVDSNTALVVFNQKANRFEFSPTQGDPSVVTVRGDYVLEPDFDPTIQPAGMGLTSGPELYAEGSKPLLAIFMDEQPDWFGVFDMEDWTVRQGVGPVLPRIMRWKFGVHLADGNPRWLVEVK
jgi:hypothetical protein